MAVDAYTKLLLHCDGADSSNVFTDEVSRKLAFTAVGNACLKTTQAKFGTTSACFDGSGDEITASSNTDWAFGTGDFTVDLWIFVNAWTTDTVFFAAGTSGGFQFGRNGNSSSWGACCWGIAWGVTSSSLPTTGVWHHVAAVRKANVMTIYLDGVSVASGADSRDYITGTARIGCNNFSGYMDELRVSKGVARWDTNFTSPSSIYTVDSYTKILLHCEGDNNSTVFLSETNISINTVGNACIKTDSKKFGTGSAYFDGSGDGLTVPNSADYDFGSGDFTIDCWVYFKSVSKGYQAIFDRRSGSDATGYILYLESNNTWSFLASTGSGWQITVLTGTGVVPVTNTWYHVAVVRYGNLYTMYINGTAIKSGSYTGAIGAITVDPTIGRSHVQSMDLYGYIDEVRLSKGIARWTTNFTPPTSQYGIVYRTSGNARLGPFILPVFAANPQSSAINWNETVPANTTITIKTAISDTVPQEEDYLTATNGSAIPGLSNASSGNNLYLKAYLTTSDVDFSPKLNSLTFQIIEEDQMTKLKISLSDAGRIKYPASDVSVNYAKASGNLQSAQGGQVQNFTQTFTAVNIDEVFDPNDVEQLTVGAATSLSVLEVFYQSGKLEESIIVTASASIVVTNVSGLPL